MGNIISIHQKIDLNFLIAQKSSPLKNSTNANSTREKMVALNPLTKFVAFGKLHFGVVAPN
jgi:hypothetical protein